MTNSTNTDTVEKARVIVDPDIELVKQAQKELPYRATAYEALMKRHDQLLYRVCYRLLGNPDDARDVSQEVMIKVFGYLPKFEGRSMFKTWLMQIARNTCFTMQAKLKRQRELRDILEYETDENAGDRIITEAMDVDTILSTLNKQDKEVLVMRYIAELQFDEIAEVCDISLSAAKMRVYRATEALKKKMGNEDK
ncbi:MAG: sigma-70 family RNA polymerase sigma factor [Cellvibrionaceae bacterium]